jgi:hypothetical protein
LSLTRDASNLNKESNLVVIANPISSAVSLLSNLFRNTPQFILQRDSDSESLIGCLVGPVGQMTHLSKSVLGICLIKSQLQAQHLLYHFLFTT